MKSVGAYIILFVMIFIKIYNRQPQCIGIFILVTNDSNTYRKYLHWMALFIFVKNCIYFLSLVHFEFVEITFYRLSCVDNCKAGFYGLYCEQPCQYPSYGYSCQQTCSCPEQRCNHITGCQLKNTSKLISL